MWTMHEYVCMYISMNEWEMNKNSIDRWNDDKWEKVFLTMDEGANKQSFTSKQVLMLSICHVA